jgi:hypothetical protein
LREDENSSSYCIKLSKIQADHPEESRKLVVVLKEKNQSYEIKLSAQICLVRIGNEKLTATRTKVLVASGPKVVLTTIGVKVNPVRPITRYHPVNA